MNEFSFKTRQKSLSKFQSEIFDILIIGGGITGAATAWDAASRGLKVALVEKNDFASGTSSRSSKLIHGGLRYLENFEFGLVFEALKERAFLLKKAPHLVKPMPFYFPVFKGEKNSKNKISLGLILYDILALFRTPGFHKRLSRNEFLKKLPYIKKDGLLGGFRYFDASMWDDTLTVQTIRAAHNEGAMVANYVEAVTPIRCGNYVSGFKVRDISRLPGTKNDLIDVRAHKVIFCVGPWTDILGKTLSQEWKPWLQPSKGVHLVFDLKRIPVPGAVVMGQAKDGRIAFVIPRTDFGSGVVIVGTTDSESPANPENVKVNSDDVNYLLELLNQYFPCLELTSTDIVSAYAGVRPLVADSVFATNSKESEGQSASSLQKVSREHYIGLAQGGVIVVAGGKYTTNRQMGHEIVDFTLKAWKSDVKKKQRSDMLPPVPAYYSSKTYKAVNPGVLPELVNLEKNKSFQSGNKIPDPLWNLYGADAKEVFDLHDKNSAVEFQDFPFIDAQLKWSIRHEMVLRLEDFYLRRIPLFISRPDHGEGVSEILSEIWADEMGLDSECKKAEVQNLKKEINKRKLKLPD